MEEGACHAGAYAAVGSQDRQATCRGCDRLGLCRRAAPRRHGSAGATPTPTLSQVQAKLKSCRRRSDKLDQQYDQVKQQLPPLTSALHLIDRELAAYSAQVRRAARRRSRGSRSPQYEDGNLNSSIALLTSGNPQQILNQSSILLELSASNDAQIDQFLAAAKQLTVHPAARPADQDRHRPAEGQPGEAAG